MSDEDNVIKLFPGRDDTDDTDDTDYTKRNLIKNMLVEAFEYVHKTPDVQEAVVIISTREETYTFRTALQDPFTFVALMELMKYKVLKEGFN